MTGEQTAPQPAVSFRSFAIATIFVRDVFGYLFIGVGFWAFLLWMDKLSLATAASPTDAQLAGLALVLGYPTGRLLFYVGSALRFVVPSLEFKNLIPAEFEDFISKLPEDRAEFAPFGIQFVKANAALLCGILLPRKIFCDDPTLYFLYIARTNTLRLMSETALGFIIVASAIYMSTGDNSLSWWKWMLSTLLLFAGTTSAARARKDQARTEVHTSWFFLSETGLQVQEAAD